MFCREHAPDKTLPLYHNPLGYNNPTVNLNTTGYVKIIHVHDMYISIQNACMSSDSMFCLPSQVPLLNVAWCPRIFQQLTPVYVYVGSYMRVVGQYVYSSNVADVRK